MRLVAVVAASGIAGAAAAQTLPTNGRLMFEFDRTTVSPQNPTVTLTVSAAWDEAMPWELYFMGVDFDLVANGGSFTNATLLMGQDPPNSAGVLNGHRVDGALIGQAFVPAVGGPCGIIPCPLPPLELAEYTWETTDFTPRSVDFRSENTSQFWMISYSGGTPINLYPNDFIPGHGVVSIVPAPGAVLGLSGVAVLACWRRR